MKSESNASARRSEALCPMCGKAELLEHPDGLLRHCFSCGRDITSVPPTGIDEVMEDIFKASRQHLLDDAETFKFLVDEHGLHPHVLIDSAMGVLPVDLDVTQFFLPKLEKAEAEQARILAAPRKVGRPTKKEQEAIDNSMAPVRRLKETRDKLGEFFDGRAAWLLFAYSDVRHRRVRIRLLCLATGETAELPLDLMGGVFNHALFAPDEQLKSLEQLQGRSIVVASELDVLQLQSLGARLAQLEDLKPQAGYLRAMAVGDGKVDARTVRALGQLPLVIRNGDNPDAAARMAAAIAVTLAGRVEFALFATTYFLTEAPLMLGAIIVFRRWTSPLLPTSSDKHRDASV